MLGDERRVAGQPLGLALRDAPEAALVGLAVLSGPWLERLDLAAALASLPPELRAVVLLVDAEGLSYAEAAVVLGTPAGTVASRLNRARAHLQAVLKGVTS